MNINIPENIRRIGENSSDYKMYIEDYVVTFLNRLSTKKEGRLLTVSLYGKIDRQEDANYCLVMGAAELGERE